MHDRLDGPEKVVLLLSLVPYLLEHGETSISALADVFDVSPDRLRPLIEFLGTAGVPGETGTYQHEDLFDIDWEAFEDRDTVSLVRAVAVDYAPRFSPSERAALIAGLHSISPLLDETQRAHASGAIEKLGASSGHEESPGILSVSPESADARSAQLAEALRLGVRVEFDYRDLQGSLSHRLVEPLTLGQGDAGWYLRGFCLDRDAERTFLVDAMRDLVVHRNQPAERRVLGGPHSVLGPDETPITATLSLRASALHRVSAFSPRIIDTAPAGESGWVRAEVQLVFPGAAVRLVQAAPGDVRVHAPENAKAAVFQWAERALAQYAR